jgi:hypothetical protein
MRNAPLKSLLPILSRRPLVKVNLIREILSPQPIRKSQAYYSVNVAKLREVSRLHGLEDNELLWRRWKDEVFAHKINSKDKQRRKSRWSENG